ncbi:MAG: efflux RND transporter periplasmic adaptor subunit [Desulfobacteraceae bacterium]|nr:efflux RND transporter periplasmic adaptor subunit [Desulfobacteraceae bacterium]
MIEQTETGWGVRAMRILVPMLIVAGGVALACFIYVTKPAAKRGQPRVKPPLVEVMEARAADHVVTLSSMGTVTPSRSMALKPRVGGFVLYTSERFVPGGIFNKGEVILTLDPTDYKLALEKNKTLVSRARAEFNLEKGRQAVARAEVKLMETTSGKRFSDSDLALRKPQLAKVQAELAAAGVDLEKARLALERTVIRAPFNCMVMEKRVEQGSQVTSQETLAVLSATDEYWVEATLPMDELAWIRFPLSGKEQGSPVTVFTRDKRAHPGRILRLLGDLAPQSRLARVLIAVKDPLGLGAGKGTPLLINSYVTVSIEGERLNNVIALPRQVARDGNGVWIARKNRLAIGQLEILWKNAETLFVESGVAPGDKIVLSELSSAVDGMAIRVQGLETGPETADGGIPGQTAGNGLDGENSGKIRERAPQS